MRHPLHGPQTGESRMNRVNLLLALDCELVSTSFLMEAKKRRSEPLYEPPPIRKRTYTPEQKARMRVQKAACKRRQREQWLKDGIVQPKDDQEREFVAQQQRRAA